MNLISLISKTRLQRSAIVQSAVFVHVQFAKSQKSHYRAKSTFCAKCTFCKNCTIFSSNCTLKKYRSLFKVECSPKQRIAFENVIESRMESGIKSGTKSGIEFETHYMKLCSYRKHF